MSREESIPLISEPSILWRDGEPYSEAYDDIYFSRNNGLEESRHVFLNNSKLPQRWQHHDSFCVAETGFGTGLNFLATLEAWINDAQLNSTLLYASVERHPLKKEDLSKALAHWPELSRFSDALIEVYPENLTPGWQCLTLFDGKVILLLGLGDAVEMFSQLDITVDAWYLDGFAPSKNPQMWSDSLFQQVGRLSGQGATVATFTVAGVVRRGLQQQGFELSKPKGFGGKRENLTGVLHETLTRRKTSQPWFDLSRVADKPKPGKIIIVGGGIAGVTSAYLLSQRGYDVELLEQEEKLATQGSGNRAGLVLPKLTQKNDQIGQFYLQAFIHTVRWLDGIKQHHPDLLWHKTGVLLRPDSKRFSSLPAWLQATRIVQPAEETDYPWLQADSNSLLICTEGGWLQPASVIDYLVTSSPDLKISTNTALLGLEKQETGWLLRTTKGDIEADTVVLANAAGAMKLSICEQLPLFRNLGQLAYVGQAQSANLPVSGKGYVIPGVDGGCVLGASYEHDLSKTEPQSRHRQTLQSYWQQLIAEPISSEQWQDRVGERFTSRDHLPLVGPMVDKEQFLQQFAGLKQGKTARYFESCEYLPGLYLNLAHGSRGLVTAYYSAIYLSQLIVNRQSIWPSEYSQLLHPGRFWVRDLRRSFKNPT